MNRKILYLFLSWLLLVMASACQSGTTKTTAGTTSGGRPTTDAGKSGTLPAVWDFDDEDDADRPADPLLGWLWQYGRESYYIIHRSERMPDPIKIGTTILAKNGNATQTTRNADGSTTTMVSGNSSWKAFINGTTEAEKVASLPTAVHETLHGYTTRFPLAQLAARHKSVTEIAVPDPDRPGYIRIPGYYAFYTGRDTTLVSLMGKATAAGEIAARVPHNLRTLRFATYVYPSNGAQSTQNSGIHGLIDEYNAYYWSLRTAYDLFGYYRDRKAGDPAAIKAWLSEIAGVYGAWAEFRYWILVALEHVRERYPDRYQALLADTTLRKAFMAIDDNWLALFGRVRERLTKEVPQLLKKKNIATGFSERAVPTDRNLPGTWFRVGQTLIYLGDRQLRLLVPVMQQKKYVDLATALRTKAAGPLPAALPTGP